MPAVHYHRPAIPLQAYQLCYKPASKCLETANRIGTKRKRNSIDFIHMVNSSLTVGLKSGCVRT